MSDIAFFFCEGLCFSLNGETAMLQDDETTLVEDILSHHEREIHIIIQHLPQPNKALWGQGSCYWTPAKRCPFGHHDNPQDLYRIAGKGWLRKEDGSWYLHTAKGSVEIDLSKMEGHYCRLAVIPAGNPAELLASSQELPDPQDVEGLMSRMQEMIKAITKLKDSIS